MAESRRNQKPQESLRVLLEHLTEGVTGCLSLRDAEGAERRVYVMEGEILAAHGPDDGPSIVRRLVNNGAITERQAEEFTQRLAQGERLDEVLFGQIPDDLLTDVLAERFHQDVLDFLFAHGVPEFEPMDAVFVENIQIGHDSREMMAELEARFERIRVLRARGAAITVRAGKTRPERVEGARLLDLLETPLRIADLVAISPFEAGKTLDLIQTMLGKGALQADGVFPTDDDEPTEVSNGVLEDELLDIPSSALDSVDVWTDDVADDALDTEPPAPAWTDAATDVMAPIIDLEELDNNEANAAEEELRRAAEEALRAEMDAEVAAELAAAQSREDEVEIAETTDSGYSTGPSGSPPPGFTYDMDDEDPFFADHDRKQGRGGADGTFIGLKDDVVVLRDPDQLAREPAERIADEESVIEAIDLESLPEDARAGIKALSFGAPQLTEDEAFNAFEIVNEALREISHVLDEVNGPGGGRAFVQLLLEGTPAEFSALYRGVEARKDGSLPIEGVLRNLQDRPRSEHRQLVNRGVEDLVERALTLSCEELDDDAADQLAERVLSYQRQLGF